MDRSDTPSRDQQRIAVIGAGPSGLAAAWSLARFDRFEVDLWCGSVDSPQIDPDDATDLAVGPLPVANAWWHAIDLEPRTQPLSVSPPPTNDLSSLRRWRIVSAPLAMPGVELGRSLSIAGVGPAGREWVVGLVAAILGFGIDPDVIPVGIARSALGRLEGDPFSGDPVQLTLLVGARQSIQSVREHGAIGQLTHRTAANIAPGQAGLIVSDDRGRQETYDQVIVATGPAELARVVPDHPLADDAPQRARISRMLAIPATRSAEKLSDPRLSWSEAADGLWTFELMSGNDHHQERVVLGATERIRRGTELSIRAVRRPSPIPWASGSSAAAWRKAQGGSGIVATLGWTLGSDLDTAVAAGFAAADRLGAPWPFRHDTQADRRFDEVFSALHGDDHRAWRTAVTVPHTAPEMQRPPAWTPSNAATVL